MPPSGLSKQWGSTLILVFRGMGTSYHIRTKSESDKKIYVPPCPVNYLDSHGRDEAIALKPCKDIRSARVKREGLKTIL